jgi:hypothetical protein
MSGSQPIHQHQPQVLAPRMTPQQYQHQQAVYQHQMQVTPPPPQQFRQQQMKMTRPVQNQPSADLSAATIGFSADSSGNTKLAGKQLQPAQAYSQVDWAAKIADVMQDQFGLKPKQQTYMYRTTYPPTYDLLPFPNQYKVPDFTKFSG